ncbi:hypothetical protein BLOT_012307 [Blomia tropicalis]|nr:hypothetical protein BLOT_012307 [Blomia tropicalis]
MELKRHFNIYVQVSNNRILIATHAFWNVSWGNLYPHSFLSLEEAILEMVEQNYQFRLVGGDDGDGDDSR